MIYTRMFVACDCCGREVPFEQHRPGWRAFRDKSWCLRCWRKLKVHTAVGRAAHKALTKRAQKLAQEKRDAQAAVVPQGPLLPQ